MRFGMGRECDKIEGMLWAENGEAVTQEARTHLERCARCRQTARAIRQTRAGLAGLRERPLPASQGDWNEARARILSAQGAQQTATRPFPLWRNRLAWSGLAAAGSICLWLALRPNAPTMRVTNAIASSTSAEARNIASSDANRKNATARRPHAALPEHSEHRSVPTLLDELPTPRILAAAMSDFAAPLKSVAPRPGRSHRHPLFVHAPKRAVISPTDNNIQYEDLLQETLQTSLAFGRTWRMGDKVKWRGHRTKKDAQSMEDILPEAPARTLNDAERARLLAQLLDAPQPEYVMTIIPARAEDEPEKDFVMDRVMVDAPASSEATDSTVEEMRAW